MFSHVLIACTLFVAAQAGYGHGGYGAQVDGYAAHILPRASLRVLPGRYGHGGYGGYGAGGYGAGGYGAGGYGSGGYGSGHGSSVITAPLAAAALAQNSVGSLTKLTLALPSAGLPNPAAVPHVAQHSITSYSAPGVALHSGNGAGHGYISGSNAAIGASLVRSSASGYGPNQIGGLGGIGIGASGVGGSGIGAGSYGGAAY